MAGELRRDNNFIPSAGGVSSTDGVTVLPFKIDPVTGRLLTDAAASSGTVTSVSVVTANGFAGSVANPTTTPAITLSTTINAPVLAGNGTAIAAATTTGSGSTVVLGTAPSISGATITTSSVNGVTLTTGGSASTFLNGAGAYTTPADAGITQLTGDVTAGPGSGSQTATLATVNANVGSFGSATQAGVFTVNGKGLITAASNTTVTPAVGSITGLGTGVATALAVNVGSAGAFVTFNGALGTPSSGTLTNCTGLPISTGVSGLGTGVAAALAVNTGSAGAIVLFNGALGTPSSGTLTNATGLPVGTGISGLGTGVATALAVNIGSAGAFVTFNGALGTPSSGTLTNCTGLPVAGGGTGAASFTAYSVICAGTTSTGAFQNVSGVGTAGQVLTSNGAAALPTWQSVGGTGISCLPYPVSMVDPGATNPVAATQLGVNTTMRIGQIIVPQAVTVNLISINVSAAGASGTLDLSLYSQDGQTRLFSVTTATISGAATVSTAVPSVLVPAGTYYIAYNNNGGADITSYFYDTESAASYAALLGNLGASKAVVEGTLTITAGTPPATITPSAITLAENNTLFVRFDN